MIAASKRLNLLMCTITLVTEGQMQMEVEGLCYLIVTEIFAFNICLCLDLIWFILSTDLTKVLLKHFFQNEYLKSVKVIWEIMSNFLDIALFLYLLLIISICLDIS